MSWGSIPLRHAAQVAVSNVDKKSVEGESPVRLVNYTDVYYGDTIQPSDDLMSATATAEQIARFRVRAGDTLITKDSETPDDIAVPAYIGSATTDMVCGYHLAMVRPNQRYHPRFLYWSMASQQVREQAGVLSNGMTRYGITIGSIQSLQVPLPPLDVQERIAEFLDDQTTRIDNIITARRQQTDLLATEMEAVAFQAVTGLSSSRTRTPSPVPWAPVLPKDWGTPRLAYLARMGTGHTPSRSEPGYWIDCDIPWLTTSDVHRFRQDQIDTISDTVIEISELGLQNSAAVLHPAGTVALSRTASAGFSIIMGRDMATSQDFATWTCGPALDSNYLLWCLRSMRRDLMGRLAMGSTHKTIYFPDLLSIRVPLPSIREQRDAVHAIQRNNEGARAAASEIRTSIRLLQELKRSLISAAVSGEFDVLSASGSQVVV